MEMSNHMAATPIVTPPTQGGDPVVPLPELPSHTNENPTLPPHTRTESTLAPTAEFTRIFLLAWSVRYIPRGLLGMAFESRAPERLKKAVNQFIDGSLINSMSTKIDAVLNAHKPHVEAARTAPLVDTSTTLFKDLKKIIHPWRGDHDSTKIIADLLKGAEEKGGQLAMSAASKLSMRNNARSGYLNIGYSLSVFLGSTLLSLRYAQMVRKDITNLFRESVAYEKNIPQEQVTYNDITRSDNSIVKNTVNNYHNKLAERLGTDSLFLLTTPLKSMYVTDLMLGVKGVQMFRDTWKRKTTMFEDLITFVNNKINPHNGLGQPISIGEVFDLYQHYAQAYRPDHAFTGVIEHASGEGARWADNQIIFQRMTELLNKTYAYKHSSIVDPNTGRTVNQADFALPKLIYLLGHDLIDVNKPKESLVAIEIANAHGMESVKAMSQMLKQGRSLDAVIQHFNLTLPEPKAQPLPTAPMEKQENGVLVKGSSMQLDSAPQGTPVTRIVADTVHALQPLQHNAAQAALA